jgi:hypothetical protein
MRKLRRLLIWTLSVCTSNNNLNLDFFLPLLLTRAGEDKTYIDTYIYEGKWGYLLVRGSSGSMKMKKLIDINYQLRLGSARITFLLLDKR